VKTTSIVIPCFNEAAAIQSTVREIFLALEANNSQSVEVIVVNDGSTDRSEYALKQLSEELDTERFRIINHHRNLGYGAALKSGIRRSNAELICITDADGTYPNQRIPELIDMAENKDMVVGSRSGANVEYSRIRSIPKLILVPWVSFLCGTTVPDMNSGLRVFRRDLAMLFLKLLPDGFSFTTTITICMLRNRHNVHFTPISYTKRIGKSHIKPIQDTARFIQLIARTGMYFAPMRLLTPVAGFFAILFACSSIHDIFFLGDITDKTILFSFITLNVLMFALLADMIDKRSSY
jgi:glycosyltransferase involved in cell wall biosynthesis